MNNLQLLNNVYDPKYTINFSSSVFRELTKDKPSISLWIENNVLNITSSYDYASHNYNNKNENIEIIRIQDKDDIVEIYNICACNYIYSKEEMLNNLISFFENKEKIHLK